MKAVIFIPTLTAGGAERVASILANTWCEYPKTFVSIILMFEDEIFYPIDPRVKIFSLGLHTNLAALARLRAIVWSLWKFRKLVKEEEPDFVLSFMNKYNIYCLVSLIKAGITTIVSERDSPTEVIHPLTLFFRPIVYQLADGIITQSRMSENYLIDKTGHPNITVIYNPVPVPKVPLTSRREKFVLNVGRLVPKKGQADLLHAFAKINRPDWNLVICGDGPLRKDLERLACDLGVENKVHFVGTVKDVQNWYARAGVFVLSSYLEGFPNVLAEAMLAGVPTVSYDCATGPSELIEHCENGYLVDVGDIDGLARYIQDLMMDPIRSKRFSLNAVKTANKVDSTVISEKYFKFCLGTDT